MGKFRAEKVASRASNVIIEDLRGIRDPLGPLGPGPSGVDT